jgi:hypothetical protein
MSKEFTDMDHDAADMAIRKAIMDLQQSHRKDGVPYTLTFKEMYELLAEAVERKLILFDK